MVYSFTCYGYKNITAKHKTTLEFTKDGNVSLKGNCIVGVRADFSLSLLKKFIENKKIQYESNKKDANNKNKTSKKISINQKPIKNGNNISIKIIMEINNYEEEINGFLNPDFNDSKEIVIRKSDFASERTLVVGADKGACDLRKELVDLLKRPEYQIKVIIE